MRISFINLNNSKEVFFIGNKDPKKPSKSRRKGVYKTADNSSLPDSFSKSSKVGKSGSKSSINFETIDTWETYVRKKLPVPIKRVGKNCYRGEALLYTPKRMNELKKRGVERVIDLAGLEHYDELCAQKGFDYVAFPIFSECEKNPIFLTREQYEKVVKESWPRVEKYDDNEFDRKGLQFIKDFKKFVDVINEGKFYICCNRGRVRTNLALLMNQYFNPKWNGDKSLRPDDDEKVLLQEFYYKLSEKDKNDLGFSKEFDNNTRKSLDIPDDW